jgi:hypothetical protein
MRARFPASVVLTVLAAAGLVAALPTPTSGSAGPRIVGHVSAQPVIDWSNEARRAIVPPTAGPENFGGKFPGEAAVYMGIVHAAIYDAAVAIEGRYRPYAVALTAPRGTSPAAAISTAAYRTLTGLQPQLGDDQARLDADYAAYLATVPDGRAKQEGIAIGQKVAAAVLALRTGDGREKNPTVTDLQPPPAGPGVWTPDSTKTVLGLRLPGIKPLTLRSAAQFRPTGPAALTSRKYAKDFAQVKELGAVGSSARTATQTTEALFWTDHDIRQWNDGLLRLAVEQRLDLVETARMLAIAHAAGGDAMIACFDAKYHYWFWRPYQAIPQADADGNAATVADAGWQPLRPTPNFPEYPSAHACHSSAVVTALGTFFGTDRIALALDSRVTGTTRQYARFRDVVKDVDLARILVGFHFRNSDVQGARLGRDVGRYSAQHFFRPSA